MKGLLLAIYAVLFIAIFSFTITNMMATYIVGDLGGSNDIATYTISFYGLGNALGVPLGRPLAERLGIARVFVGCLVVFSLSFSCSICNFYPLFIGLRFLQGYVAGPFYFLIQNLLSRLVPPEKSKTVTAIIVTLFTIVPVLGATYGGWIAYDYIWRRAFYFSDPFNLLLALFLWNRLKKLDLPLAKTPFDAIGYIFFFLGIFCLGFSIATVQQLDWYRSPLIVTTFLIGISSFVFFILWCLNHPDPILDLKLLKNKIFSFALLNLALLFSAYFGMIMLLALWLNLYAQYTPIWIGLLIGTMAIAAIFPTFLIYRFHYLDTRYPLAIAILFFAASSFYTTIFSVDIDLFRIAVSRVLAGFGLAFFLPPIFRLLFDTFPKEKSVNVMSLFQIVRTLASGLGVAIYTTVWQRRQVFFHERLGEQLTAFSTETQQFYANADELFHIRGGTANAQLGYFLDRQSTALALDDTFYLMAWILTALLALLLFTTFFSSKGFRLTDTV